MTDLERFFRRLVDNLIAIDPARLHRPLTLGELSDSVVPYRTNRRSLSIDTNEDYDMLLLRLASGEGGFLRMSSEGVRAQFQGEATSHHPNLGLLRELAGAEFVLGTQPLAHALGPDPMLAYAPPEEEEVEMAEAGGADEAEEISLDALRKPSFAPETPMLHWPPDQRASLPAISREIPREVNRPAEATRQTSGESARIGGIRCGFCGGGLPANRAVNFCPHCGQNQTFTRCPECQSELELGWRHCIRCGHMVGE